MSATANVDLVTLKPADPAGPAMRLHLVGDDTVSGGGARWEEVQRPRRRTAVEWVGTDAHRKAIPLLLTGVDVPRVGVDTSVEGLCRTLASWAQPTKATGRPPLLLVFGPLKLPSYPCLWVIDELAWDDASIRKADGRRVQQGVTVTLVEYTAAEVLLGPAAAARAKAGH